MPHGTNSAVFLDIAFKSKWVGETHYCGWLRWMAKVVKAVKSPSTEETRPSEQCRLCIFFYKCLWSVRVAGFVSVVRVGGTQKVGDLDNTLICWDDDRTMHKVEHYFSLNTKTLSFWLITVTLFSKLRFMCTYIMAGRIGWHNPFVQLGSCYMFNVLAFFPGGAKHLTK